MSKPLNGGGIILACDVGGTSIKLGLASGRRLLAKSDIAARPGEGLALALRRIESAGRSLCGKAGIKRSQLTGFGLSFPGIIEPHTDHVLSTPEGKFDDAKSIDIPRLVEQLLGLPTRVCNDANAALLGEWRFGAARGCRSAVLMTLGTGIGTSAIIDGVPLRGQHGQAGCLGGHLLANLYGQPCRCPNVGCAESEASTWALTVQALRHPALTSSRLAREKILDYAAVFRLAARGDHLALELRDRAVHVWSTVLVNLIHAYDPECAIIGGGIMRSASTLLPRFSRYVSQHAWTPWGKMRILPAALRNDAGMLGVASLFDNKP